MTITTTPPVDPAAFALGEADRLAGRPPHRADRPEADPDPTADTPENWAAIVADLATELRYPGLADGDFPERVRAIAARLDELAGRIPPAPDDGNAEQHAADLRFTPEQLRTLVAAGLYPGAVADLIAAGGYPGDDEAARMLAAGWDPDDWIGKVYALRPDAPPSC